MATGNKPLAGEYKGVDAILGYYGKLFELSDGTFTAELETMKVEGDDSVVATHRDKAKRGDTTRDQAETHRSPTPAATFTRPVETRPDTGPRRARTDGPTSSCLKLSREAGELPAGKRTRTVSLSARAMNAAGEA